MLRNTTRLIISGFFLSLSFMSTAQIIWPGDVNNNGVVNGIDVLFAGIAYGSDGPERPDGSSDWEGQPAGDSWSDNFPGGLNFAYADCDGNGEVEEDDIEVTIKNNFFLTHGTLVPDEYSNGIPGQAPPVRLMPQNTNVSTGQSILFDLWLGDEEHPVQDFYGIAISMKYNPDFILGGSWDFDETNNAWFDPSEDHSRYLLAVDESAGKIELAITRTDQHTTTGSGKVGELSIVIEDIVFGLQDTLNIQIENIRMIDKDFNNLSVVPDSTFVIISTPNQIEETVQQAEVTVFPNPGNGHYQITSNQTITRLELTDLTGRSIPFSATIQPGNLKTNLTINGYYPESQLYLLKIVTEKEIIVKRIIQSDK
ncbi:MAG: T9SS type A sorting domain-containing protein [Saprospiraceae bacterium]|nr:T9SS type A sorting domain-containing protein [Saprospiraceae bacterium]MCB9325826.1 T9SS type A sorting domain-containing protein [Lewinellaceae bacterium]